MDIVPPAATVNSSLHESESTTLDSSGNITPTPSGNPQTQVSRVLLPFPDIPFTVRVTVSLVSPGAIAGRLSGDIVAVYESVELRILSVSLREIILELSSVNVASTSSAPEEPRGTTKEPENIVDALNEVVILVGNVINVAPLRVKETALSDRLAPILPEKFTVSPTSAFEGERDRLP